MRRPALQCLCVACVVTLAACSLVGSDDGTVTAQATPSALKVVNQTKDTVHTFVVGRETAAAINWAAGVGGDGLPPGEQRRIPYTDIDRRPDEGDVIVYWWKSVESDGERVPGPIQNLVVEL